MHQPLRGHIPQCSALSSFLLNNFISPLKQKSKSKIADVYFPRFIQQQVRRFDIAVQNAAAVADAIALAAWRPMRAISYGLLNSHPSRLLPSINSIA